MDKDRLKFYGSRREKLNFDFEGFKETLNSLEGDFEVKIILAKDIRTHRMNNTYWWWLGLLSDHTGYTKRELHSYFKAKFLCEEDEINGEKFKDCKSTADLTIKEFSIYLLEISNLSSETFGMVLPDTSLS